MIAKPLPIIIDNAQLGESPCWDILTQRLYWTDIKQKLIHRYDPVSHYYETCEAPKMACFVLPTRGGGLIAGLEDGLYKMDFEKGNFYSISSLNEAEVRLNDGKCDPCGRIWFGTMPRDESSDKKIAKLYCFQDKLGEKDRGLGVANGKCWTNDGRFFYHVDTADHIIWRYSYNLNNGDISEKKIFCKTNDPPDGLCCDCVGNIYVALYGAGRVDIFSPEGQKINSIEVSAKEVTSCAFGGADLKILYITTATEGIFQMDMSIAGIAECPASISTEIDKAADKQTRVHSS